MTAAPPTRKPDAGALIDQSLRQAEMLQRKGYPYVIHPLMDGVPRVQPALLQAWLDWAVAQKDLWSTATLLMAPEAMALPLVAPLSLATGLPYVVVRKRRYHRPGEQVAYCETGYGENCLHVNDAQPTDKVLLVDDVLSTGGTLGALGATLAQMKVPLVGALVFVDKGNARAKLETQLGVPLRCMRTVAVRGQHVELLDRDVAPKQKTP